MGSTEPRMWLSKPIHKHAVFSQPVHYAVGADHGRVHSAGEDEYANNNDKNVEYKTKQRRAGEIHGQTAQQVIHILMANRVGNNHARE